MVDEKNRGKRQSNFLVYVNFLHKFQYQLSIGQMTTKVILAKCQNWLSSALA